jgi:hypothetical protein
MTREELLGKHSRMAAILLIVVAFLLLGFAVYLVFPVSDVYDADIMTLGADWKRFFRPAILSMLSGASPYGQGAYNPPWVFILLSPLAFLPPHLGSVIMFVLTFFAYGAVLFRLGVKPWLALLILTSFPVIEGADAGNVDWMIALGFVLPPQIGLFLVLAKPQMGFGIAVYWLVEAYRRGGTREVARVFSPVTAALIFSFFVYGLWPLSFGEVTFHPWNMAIWPVGVFIGIPILVFAIRRTQPCLSLASSPFLSPYVAGPGWAAFLIGLIPYPVECAAAIAASWLMYLVMIVIKFTG